MGFKIFQDLLEIKDKSTIISAHQLKEGYILNLKQYFYIHHNN